MSARPFGRDSSAFGLRMTNYIKYLKLLTFLFKLIIIKYQTKSLLKNEGGIVMKIHDTTARQEADERLADAQKGIKALREYLTTLDEQINIHREQNRGLGFHIDWGTQLINKALIVYNEIVRCNGATLVRATLVRATEPAKDETVLVTCEPNGTKCNICGLQIPDGDDMCGNAHEPGQQYRVPKQTD